MAFFLDHVDMDGNIYVNLILLNYSILNLITAFSSYIGSRREGEKIVGG